MASHVISPQFVASRLWNYGIKTGDHERSNCWFTYFQILLYMKWVYVNISI